MSLTINTILSASGHLVNHIPTKDKRTHKVDYSPRSVLIKFQLFHLYVYIGFLSARLYAVSKDISDRCQPVPPQTFADCAISLEVRERSKFNATNFKYFLQILTVSAV